MTPPVGRDPYDQAHAVVAAIDDRIPPVQPKTCSCGDDEDCFPCARCGHTDCRHEDDGLQYRDCRVAGCRCHLWLSDSDCLECDGIGSFSVDVEVAGGAVREDDRPCPWCRGSGLAQ